MIAWVDLPAQPTLLVLLVPQTQIRNALRRRQFLNSGRYSKTALAQHPVCRPPSNVKRAPEQKSWRFPDASMRPSRRRPSNGRLKKGPLRLVPCAQEEQVAVCRSPAWICGEARRCEIGGGRAARQFGLVSRDALACRVPFPRAVVPLTENKLSIDDGTLP